MSNPVRVKIVDGARVPIYKKKYKPRPKQFLKGIKIIQEKITRRCLNCSLLFEADGRFNRLCSACKNSERYRCADAEI